MGMNAKNIRDYYDECHETWRDGYLIPVRNRLSNMIEREFLPQEMKIGFRTKFGEKILFDDEFIDWYCSFVKKIS